MKKILNVAAGKSISIAYKLNSNDEQNVAGTSSETSLDNCNAFLRAYKLSEDIAVNCFVLGEFIYDNHLKTEKRHVQLK